MLPMDENGVALPWPGILEGEGGGVDLVNGRGSRVIGGGVVGGTEQVS